MRAFKMFGGIVLMIASVPTLLLLVLFDGPHPFLISVGLFVVGLGIFLYYRYQNRK